MNKANNLVLVTGGVLWVGAFLDHKQKKDKGLVTDSADLMKRLIAITLLIVVLSITVDQAPAFGKPFTLLVLVASIIKTSSVYTNYFNQTQGKTK